jgi:hypothetical protein
VAAGNGRMSLVTLTIGPDIRVLEDSLPYEAFEVYESSEVAVLQHASGILQFVNNGFENGTTYFKNLVYTTSQFAVSSGDCALLVGHKHSYPLESHSVHLL